MVSQSMIRGSAWSRGTSKQTCGNAARDSKYLSKYCGKGKGILWCQQ